MEDLKETLVPNRYQGNINPAIENIDGATFEQCKLDRKKYADVLSSIVRTYSEGFVLAVNNKWGEGKTTFIKFNFN